MRARGSETENKHRTDTSICSRTEFQNTEVICQGHTAISGFQTPGCLDFMRPQDIYHYLSLDL